VREGIDGTGALLLAPDERPDHAQLLTLLLGEGIQRSRTWLPFDLRYLRVGSEGFSRCGPVPEGTTVMA
jgi:hypothetical protein